MFPDTSGRNVCPEGSRLQTGCAVECRHLGRSRCAAQLPNEGLDGALIMPCDYAENAEFYARVAKSGPPVVLVDHYFPDCTLDRVVSDNLSGARQAVEHLIAQGHRRIAHFTDFEEITSTMDRELGYRVALENAGIAYDEGIVCGPQLTPRKQWSFEHALEHCLNLQDPVTRCSASTTTPSSRLSRQRVASDYALPATSLSRGSSTTAYPKAWTCRLSESSRARLKWGRTAARLLLERVGGAVPRAPRHILVPALLVPSNVALAGGEAAWPKGLRSARARFFWKFASGTAS